MKIVLAKRNISLFGRIIQNLAKLRDEICVEVSSEGFGLKSVNSIQTCFANFLFRPAFFSDFVFDGAPSECLLVPSKALLHVFKNLHAIERTTDKLVISFESGQDFIGFLLMKADGLQTQYELNYADSPADWIPDLGSESADKLAKVLFNSLTASSAVFSEAFNNFFSAEEKVCFMAFADRIILRSLDDQSNDSISNAISQLKKLKMRKPGFTELVISEKELISYLVKDYNSDCSVSNQTADVNKLGDSSKNESTKKHVVFSLKYFKLVLSLLQLLSLDLNLSFGKGGVPMKILLSETNLWRGEFWIATTTTSSLSENCTSQNNLNSKKQLQSVQQVTLKDIPEDFPEDENFDNFICSLGAENEDGEAPVQEIVPVVDLTKPSENIPSGTQKSQSKDENKSPIIESHPIGRRPTFKHISIEDGQSSFPVNSENGYEDIKTGPVGVKFIDPSTQGTNSVSVDLNEIARKKIKLSENDSQSSKEDVSQSVENARNAIHLMIFGNGNEAFSDSETDLDNILVAESDDET